MTKHEVIALRAKYAGKIDTLKEKTRQGVDTAEIGAGAAMAGYLDIAVPTVMGVPTSAITGVALFVAGSVSDQRDLTMLGTGMIAGAAYKQGAALALSAATKSTSTQSATAKVVNG